MPNKEIAQTVTEAHVTTNIEIENAEKLHEGIASSLKQLATEMAADMQKNIVVFSTQVVKNFTQQIQKIQAKRLLKDFQEDLKATETAWKEQTKQCLASSNSHNPNGLPSIFSRIPPLQRTDSSIRIVEFGNTDENKDHKDHDPEFTCY